MEERAPYFTPALPPAPHGLLPSLLTWLRRQGFDLDVTSSPTYQSVGAQWTSPRGEQFLLVYTWMSGPSPLAGCHLHATLPGQPTEPLFGTQLVRHLHDVRVLLLGNVRYRNARLLARSPHPAL